MGSEANKSMLFFSVVIPTYNSEGFIGKSLSSVFSQTYDNYEVIISDDGSTDHTIRLAEDVFRKYPYRKKRILINRHIGPGAARNRGIEVAVGEWICFLDSDDIWFEQKLQKVAETILNIPDANIICHNIIAISGGKKELIRFSQAFNKRISPLLSLYRKNTLTPSAVAVKKELLIKVGMFDEFLHSAQDYDLWLRLTLLSDIRIEYVEEPLSYFIYREGSISSNIELRLKCLLEINKRYYRLLKPYVRFPIIERMRYVGKWYAWAGLQLIGRKKFGKGIYLFLIGLFKWPFRFDWIAKVIKRKKDV